MLDKYVRHAAMHCPLCIIVRITPHTLRHSSAVAMLQAGVDVIVIRDLLGHASVATTNRYMTVNLRMKRVALQAFWRRAHLEQGPRRRWRPSPKLLTLLESLC